MLRQIQQGLHNSQSVSMLGGSVINIGQCFKAVVGMQEMLSSLGGNLGGVRGVVTPPSEGLSAIETPLNAIAAKPADYIRVCFSNLSIHRSYPAILVFVLGVVSHSALQFFFYALSCFRFALKSRLPLLICPQSLVFLHLNSHCTLESLIWPS